MYLKKHLLSLTAAMFSAALFCTGPTSAAAADKPNYRYYAQGLYEISCSYDPDYVWDIKTCTLQDHDSTSLQLYHSLNVNQQKFYVENFASDCWRISDLRTGAALTASSDNKNVSMSTMEHPASAAQTWILEKAGDDSFYIKASSGKYLTMYKRRAYCGTPLILADFNGGLNQKWHLNSTWLSAEDSADTDLVNPYGEDGPYSNLHLVMNFPDHTEELTASMLSEHIIETENHTYELDPEFLPAFVENLAATYNTQQNPRRFITTAGNEITLTKGNYGWKLNNEKMLALIQENLQTNQMTILSPEWEHKVTRLGNENDINDMGDSYIEVDIGIQKVWLYQYGELILETDCVTGTKNHTDTVQGAFAIFQHRSPATLNGPGYSSYVDFWMPFYNGYGLHNASWRGSFGGEIYKSNGSHGCVNLPYDAAKTIYETAQIGYPVIVYSSLPEDADY